LTTSRIALPDETRILSVTFVAILALTVFRLVTLVKSPTNLQFDEAQYWGWSRHIAFGYVSKPPLIAWIIAATTWLFGDSESAIRAAAPLLHAVTALALYGVGARMYNKLTGFWCAVAYATLPSVAYSSLIISTDAVLLPFWALGLGAWWRLLEVPSRRTAIFLGICIGGGLLAKYAMAYFILGIAVHLATSPMARSKFKPAHLAIALVVALAIVAPNLWWNFSHGWATFGHTADNADWEGTRKGGLMPLLEFLAGQLAIFGPVLAGVGVFTLCTLKRRTHEREIMLAAFCLPILAVVCVQCVIAGAHVNWAAPAYLSLTVLVVARCVVGLPKWLVGSTVLHLVLTVICCFAFAGFIPTRDMPKHLDPLNKLRGWDVLAKGIQADMLEYPGYTILFDERKYAVLFNYYLRNSGYHLVIWPFKGKTHSEFAMDSSIDVDSGKHTILVSRWPDPGIENNFLTHKEIGILSLTMGKDEPRTFHIFACDGLGQTP
jgi:4-amino-4-deoxy-L-arabinose transferase-like glycosyltransferase